MINPAKVNLIHYNKTQLESFQDFLWGPNEPILVAEDVEQIQSNDDVDKRSLIITLGVLYLFEPDESSKFELIHELTVLDLQEVSYQEPDLLTLTYGNEKYTIKTEDALAIGQLLVNQFEFIYYHVNNAPTLKIESDPPSKLLPASEIKFRPHSLFQTRVVVFSHYYKSPYKSQNLKIFKEWDLKPSGAFKIDGSYDPNGDARPLARAISYDADITHLIINNFAPDQLGPFISTIFENSIHITDLTFQNIPSSADQEFDFTLSENCMINSITFKESHADVIISFINGLEKYVGKLKTFALCNIELAKEEISDILQSLASMDCFSELQSLIFDVLKIHDFPLQEFSLLIPKLVNLTSLTVNQLDAEGSEMYNMLMRKMQTLRHIEILNMKFTVRVEEKLNDSVTYLNISESEFNAETFSTLMKSIFSESRNTPLFLIASNLKGTSTKNFLQGINFLVKPVLNELNWDCNHLGIADIDSFVKFLKTQTELKFLSINKCFNKEDEPEKSLQVLSKLLHESPIEGISMQVDVESPIPSEAIFSFLSSMSNCEGLRSLHFTDTRLGEAGIDPFVKFVNDSPDLTEFDFDGIGLSSTNELLRFYNRLLKDPKILSVGIPQKEFDAFEIDKKSRTPEIKKMLSLLKSKKSPKTLEQRLTSIEHSQTDMDELNSEEGFDFESLLTLVLPSSLVPKAPSSPTKGNANAIDEIEALMRSMVAVMRNEQPERQVDPLPMGKMIMEHLSTSKKVLKTSADMSKYPF